MRRSMNPLVALVAAAVLLIGPTAGPVAAASPFPGRIDLPDGWSPEGLVAGAGTTLYVGSLADGAIWRGDARTGEGGIFVQGVPGRVAVGLEYDAEHDRLWAVGGATGEVRAYDASSGALLHTYTFSPAGFLNDLAITSDAVYVTDSGIQQLDVIPLDGGAPFTRPLTGDITYVPGQINANGIVAARGWLITVNTTTGELFRVDPATGETTAIDLGGESVSFGDGLQVRGSTLYVVRNFLNSVAVFRLGADLTSARLTHTVTSGDFDVPTTADLVAGSLWVVNARFSTPPTPDTPYWIARVSALP